MVRALLLILSFAALEVTHADVTVVPELTVGDPAPKLTVMKWVKGAPVSEFIRGQAYIVDFWATWCGPCIQAMPHLSELAQKYDGKLTVLSIHTEVNPELRERAAKVPTGDYIETIRKFVDQNASKMKFTVGIEDPIEAPLVRSWIKAANEHGIPRTFLVDRSGIIVWIGNPLMTESFNRSVAQMLDGTIDVAENRAQRLLKVQVEQASMFVRNKRYEEALAILEKMRAEHPQFQKRLVDILTLQSLLHVNEDEGLARARVLASDERFSKGSGERKGRFGEGYRSIGSMITSQDGLSQKAYRTGLEYLQVYLAENPDGNPSSEADIRMLQAKAHAMLGAFERAVAAQERAIALFEKSGMNKAVLDELRRALEAYRAGTLPVG